jgi:hypothetical protein
MTVEEKQAKMSELLDTVKMKEMHAIHNRMLCSFKHRQKSESFRLYSLLEMSKESFGACLKYKTSPLRPVKIRATCHTEIAKTMIEWSWAETARY